MSYRIYSERTDYGRSDKLAIIRENFAPVGGGLWVAEPLRFKKLSEGDLHPTFTFESPHRGDDARALMQAFLDHAWSIGMRPAGFADTTEQVGAIKAHLEDMRTLVFQQKVPS